MLKYCRISKGLTIQWPLRSLTLLHKGVEDLRQGPQDAQVLRNGPLGLQGIQVQPQEALPERA